MTNVTPWFMKMHYAKSALENIVYIYIYIYTYTPNIYIYIYIYILGWCC